jgi:hypothetical protein
MISTNLSTRPFYNERLVHTVLVVVSVLVLAVTALNVGTIVTLSEKDLQQNAQAARAEKKAAEARQAAERIRRSIDPSQLKAVTAAAVEANRLIDERTFSWTQLLSDFEHTLPADVRITAVTPRVDKEGRMFIDLVVVGRRAEDINEFVDKLEARGAFADIMWRQESLNNEGLRETTLVGRYIGSARRAN